MLYNATTFALRDGREAVLRNPKPEPDAAPMIDHLKQIASETEFLLRYPEECRWTEEQERNVLADINASDMRLMLVCEVGGEIAGMCGLNFNGQIKFRHKANLDIGIRSKFWGQGIGTAMMNAMIGVARERGVEQLELDYIEGNARGRALYEKMGFVRVAEHPDAVKLKDGSYRKLVFMMKKL